MRQPSSLPFFWQVETHETGLVNGTGFLRGKSHGAAVQAILSEARLESRGWGRHLRSQGLQSSRARVRAHCTHAKEWEKTTFASYISVLLVLFWDRAMLWRSFLCQLCLEAQAGLELEIFLIAGTTDVNHHAQPVHFTNNVNTLPMEQILLK